MVINVRPSHLQNGGNSVARYYHCGFVLRHVLPRPRQGAVGSHSKIPDGADRAVDNTISVIDLRFRHGIDTASWDYSATNRKGAALAAPFVLKTSVITTSKQK